ncbi:unnamed protein product, partial [Mesorhabditis spiculigera]
MKKNTTTQSTTVIAEETTTPPSHSDDYTNTNDIGTTEYTPLYYDTERPYNFTGLSGDFYQWISYADSRLLDRMGYDSLVCKKGPGDMQMFGSEDDYWANYQWNGVPFHLDLNGGHTNDELKIAASMFVLGIIGMGLAATSGFLVVKNAKVSKIVSIGMIADASCRFINSVARFYYGKCLFDWGCLKSDGYPFSGIMFNMLWSTLDYTSYLTMGLLQHWISVIRCAA